MMDDWSCSGPTDWKVRRRRRRLSEPERCFSLVEHFTQRPALLFRASANRSWLADESLLTYVRSATETAQLVGSTGNGALILAAAGLLEGAWRRHMRNVRTIVRTRRDALVEVVRRDLPKASLSLVPSGGLHLWLKLSDEVDDVSLADEVGRAGVMVSAGRHWFPAEPPGSFLRISYAGADIDVLSEGVAVLARKLDTMMS